MAAVHPSLEARLAALELTPQVLADRDARIAAWQLRDAWAALVALAGPGIALEVAAATPVGAFGVVEYVCRSAPTIGEALQRWVRYLNLLDDVVEVALIADDDDVSLEVVVESATPCPQAHELCFGLVVAQCRDLSRGRFAARRVELSHALHDVDPYRRFFGCEVVAGAERCRLVMPRRMMGLELASADPNLLAILERHAEELRAKEPAAPPMTEQVRRILATHLRDGDLEIAHVAARLGLTARSLQRRLKDEGSVFQSVRDGVRRELATRYLASGQLAIAEISFLLGFSEPSAFFRAHKRWTGHAPGRRM